MAVVLIGFIGVLSVAANDLWGSLLLGIDILAFYIQDYRCFWGRMKETSGVVCTHMWKNTKNRGSVKIGLQQTTPEVDFPRKRAKDRYD